MKLAASPNRAARRSAFTLLEVLVVVAILVILATVASIAVMQNLDTAKQNQAHLKAATIARACETFYLNPSSGNNYPTTLDELVATPWNGQSLLNDGANDLLDPWGKRYQMQLIQGNDNSTQGRILVYTTAPDNNQTPISNFGVGPNARMN